MKIGIPAETRPGETRVAATPETVKKLVAGKHQVIVQSGAGVSASIPDDAFTAVGAQIGTAADAFGCDMVLKVRAPAADERAQMKPGTVLIGMLNPCDAEGIAAMASSGTGDNCGQTKCSPSPRLAISSPNRRDFHDAGEEQKPCR